MSGKRGAHGFNVILAEDNSRIRELESEALGRLGYDVSAAASADEALQLLNQVSCDLLIADIHLEGPLTGVELAKAAKKLSRDIKVLLVGGDLDHFSRRDFRDICDAVLRKPFALEQLEHEAGALVGRPPTRHLTRSSAARETT